MELEKLFEDKREKNFHSKKVRKIYAIVRKGMVQIEQARKGYKYEYSKKLDKNIKVKIPKISNEEAYDLAIELLQKCIEL